MSAKKHITILRVFGGIMILAGATYADVVSFSDDISFDHDKVISMRIFNEDALDYRFLSDNVSLPQFDLGSGLLDSVTLAVEPDITVDTYFSYKYSYAYTTMYWYSDLVGTVNGLHAMYPVPHTHNYNHIGEGYYHNVFSIDATASATTSSGLADFIGTGEIDVAITGDDKLNAWWNPYTHEDTDTYGTVTTTISYDYTPVCVDIQPGVYPNMLKVKSKGPLAVAILGTTEFDVTQVDPDSVTVGGVPPLSWELEDVGTPGSPTEGPDGTVDLTYKFSTPQVVATLGQVHNGQEVALLLTGSLATDGRVFGGRDTVFIEKKGK